MTTIANVGDVLAGKFRVDRILGIGGMGMVVLATNIDLEQQVAIKFMLPQAMENAEAAARFMREARAAARLTNDHVCKVSDVGKFDSGAHYMVMEYMEGLDLGTLLKRQGAQPVTTAVDYLLQACEGIAEAHGHGIVHRDLKPDNLFLAARADGSQIIKILDFGISKAAVTGIATKTGDIMGSPAYMAPEQMQSTKDVDERADIWSLGVILYQLISGRMPFIADTLPALCLAVINDAPPSLESVRKNLPSGLAEVVMKCLSKSRDERYRNVHQLAQALAPYGKPESANAVTRIRGMLMRRRPPTPPPLMMLPSEFSDVAPTLVGTDDSLDIPKTPTPTSGSAARKQDATRTTMGGSSGESMSLAHPRVPRGVVGALLGAIALVGLIIVMVLVKKSHETSADDDVPGPPPAAAHGTADDTTDRADVTPPPPTTPPSIEPIDADTGPTATNDTADHDTVGSSDGDGTVTVEETAPTIDSSTKKHHHHHHAQTDGTKTDGTKTAKTDGTKTDGTKTAKPDGTKTDGTKTDGTKTDGTDGTKTDGADGTKAGSGSASDDNPWGHMLHDGDKQP